MLIIHCSSGSHLGCPALSPSPSERRLCPCRLNIIYQRSKIILLTASHGAQLYGDGLPCSCLLRIYQVLLGWHTFCPVLPVQYDLFLHHPNPACNHVFPPSQLSGSCLDVSQDSSFTARCPQTLFNSRGPSSETVFLTILSVTNYSYIDKKTKLEIIPGLFSTRKQICSVVLL